MTHRVAVANYGGHVLAWLLDLPGVVLGGDSIADVERQLPLVIAEHIAWLGEHAEVIASDGSWEIVETLDVDDQASELCFASEKTPLSREELEILVRRFELARADLIVATEHLPDALLAWAPPRSTVRRFDPWAPDVRSIADIKTHVLQLEVYYRDGLRDGPVAGIVERVDDPARELACTVDLLRSLSDADRARVYRPTRPSRTTPDEWTARKVLRRLISHERAHTAEIVQRRTWLLIGLPS